MIFYTRRKLAERQLDFRWRDYEAAKNGDEIGKYYAADFFRQYNAVHQAIMGMGYWVSKKNGKHKVVRRRFSRFGRYWRVL